MLDVSDDVTYVLERVRGQALPAPASIWPGRTFLVLEGMLMLHADGRYTEATAVRVIDHTSRDVDAPLATRDFRHQTTGRWAVVAGRGGPAVECTPDPRPLPPPNVNDLSLGHRPLFHIADGGRVLDGAGTPHASYLYRRATP